ncbi:hypothetical protein [Propionibacterium freudenreichii]|uniref:Uncharacterized protein n=2 Tax=root TaxID=1 RepID=A0A1D8ETK8_9CAUD|nr:hypothetical protein [Propionibacterium freudenreichii]YP_009596826.1 hypothetical protein FDH08_gp23 [Propionibacterium phage B22]AOT24375.1 hypothetical protein B22_23 [Propionibacterium phage B22]ARO11728.1 hypothetical protein BMR99_03580 [Propionibacterium freudenreichii]MDK9627004.1 hypothetical protein [Propionibacterium freudenreichii]CEH07845.1 Protein of unknown function [Propionibacterium freudenreichii]SBW77590.1 Hypothetical protein PFR_JS22-1_1942 [Propionibacterium freudenre
MNDFQTWITVLGGAGFLGALVTLIKGLVGWRTGKSGRKMRAAHDAIDSLNLAGLWAEAYWHARGYCRSHHEWTSDYADGYPPPPDDTNTPD